MSNKKVRIELQYDPIKDKDTINFIDKNGSTRAGFIKSLILQYKNAMEDNTVSHIKNTPIIQERKNSNQPQKTGKKIPKLGQSYSSKDLN